MHARIHLTIVVTLLVSGPAAAGIHLSTIKLEPNPDLRAFLGQLRDLRSYGPTDPSMLRLPGASKDDPSKSAASKTDAIKTLRQDFLDRVAALQAKQKKERLSPDELADLGGYLLYLKQTTARYPAFEEAIAVLEGGFRAHPRHFALAANLGTAYQLSGRLDAALRCLEAAADLAPDAQRAAVKLQLRLVQQRQRESLNRGLSPDLDTLFGHPSRPFRFVDENGEWNYGRLAPAEIAKLPNQSVEEAVRQLQVLLLALPDDGRLLWQLGEWALVLGNKPVALQLFNGSVDMFRLSHPMLKQHRHLLLEAMNWGTIAERLGGPGKPEQWVVRVLGQALVQGIPHDGLGGAITLARECRVKAEEPNLLAQFGEEAEPPPKPFVMQPWHWVLIAVGAVMAVLLLLWQVQQFVRPRRIA